MHVYMQQYFSPHNLAQQTSILQSIVQPAPEQYTEHDRRISASVPWLTPSLRCARRNLLQASPRDCCTTAVLPCCLALLLTRQRRERKIVAGPLYRAVCAWPLHLQTLFSLSFPAFPEAAAAYFLHALYRRPTPSRSHSGHNGRTYARRRQLLTLEGHLRRPPSLT